MIYQVVYSGGDYEEYFERPVLVTDNYEKAVEAANKIANTINRFIDSFSDIELIEVRRFQMNQNLININNEGFEYLGYDYKCLWEKRGFGYTKLTKKHDDDWYRMDLG